MITRRKTHLRMLIKDKWWMLQTVHRNISSQGTPCKALLCWAHSVLGIFLDLETGAQPGHDQTGQARNPSVKKSQFCDLREESLTGLKNAVSRLSHPSKQISSMRGHFNAREVTARQPIRDRLDNVELQNLTSVKLYKMIN